MYIEYYLREAQYHSFIIDTFFLEHVQLLQGDITTVTACFSTILSKPETPVAGV